MVFYALVAADSDFAIDLYPSLEHAEQELANVLRDEPSFDTLLSIVPIDLSRGSELP